MIDFGKTLDPSLFELILQQPKNANSTMLADHNRQLSGADKNSDSPSTLSYSPPAHANLLPPDANYDLTSVCKLYLMPNVRMMFAGNAANKILLSDPSSLNVPGPSDAGPLLSETPMFQTNGASVFNTSSNQLNSSGMWDLGMVPEIANASFLNSSMHYGGGGSNDEGAEGADDEDQYGFTNAEILHSEPIDDLLVAAPMQVSRLTINYARRAKRVDVKKLKLNIWRDLCTRSGEPSRAKDMEKVVAESMEDKKTFQEVLDQLPSNSSDKELEDISVPYCFICLLHLANEKGLTIENTDSGDLLIHQN